MSANMSLPPVTVRIKRKATDEPVDYLRVQESNGKRQRKADFVFSRQVEPLEDESTSSSATVPDVTRPIKQPRKSICVQTNGTDASQYGAENAGKVQASTLATGASTEAGQPIQADYPKYLTKQNETTQTPSSAKHQPRTYRISRIGSSTPTKESIIAGRVQKRQTVFVERKTRLKASPTGSPPHTPALTDPSKPHTPALISEPEPSQVHIPEIEQSRTQKKPGLAARTTSSNTTPISRPSHLEPTPRNVRLPSGLIAPWSLNDQQLVDEMQAYTLQEIGHSIAEAELTQPKALPASTSRSTKKPSRFKPKIPKLRYHERHPEDFAKDSSEMEVEELAEDMDDDSEYIIDTYVRIPADYMEVDPVTEKNVGLLVLDGQSDIDEFYNNGTDSDEDDDYDEEDENAENHYTADYPDDEVDSDDEYGRNPYQYAKDGAAFSDGENGAGTKYSWSKKPAWLRKANGEIDVDDEDDDNDDDDE